MKCELRLLNQELVIKYKEQIMALMKDLSVFHQSDNQEYCTSKYRDMLNFLKDSTAIILGVFDEEKLIAYAWGYCRNIMDTKKMHITQIVVQKQYRCSGIGKKMIEYMMNYSKKNNWRGIELNVRGENCRALCFYKANGFLCERIMLSRDIIK